MANRGSNGTSIAETSRNNHPARIVNANVLVQQPTQALRPFIKRFVFVDFPFDRKLKLLPDTNLVAEFRFRGENALDGGTNLPRAVISGLWDTARTRTYPRGTAILMVMFTETGATAFLPEPLDSLFNRTTAIDNVISRAPDFGRLIEQLAAAKDHAHRVQVAERFFLERARNSSRDPFASAAIAWIEQTQAAIRIEELAQRVGLSQSALERRFRRSVGTSPKQFASILRVKNAFRLRAQGHGFTSIAYSAGYSDQSHFINDFKRVTGLAPSAFFQESAVCTNAQSLQVAFAAN
jgi:AraC-like DNA-binding protein